MLPLAHRAPEEQLALASAQEANPADDHDDWHVAVSVDTVAARRERRTSHESHTGARGVIECQRGVLETRYQVHAYSKLNQQIIPLS